MALYLPKKSVTLAPEQLAYLSYYKTHNTCKKVYKSKQNTSIIGCLTFFSYSIKAYPTSVYLNLHKSRGNPTLQSLGKKSTGIQFLSKYYYWVISAASVLIAQNLFLGI